MEASQLVTANIERFVLDDLCVATALNILAGTGAHLSKLLVRELAQPSESLMG